MKPCIFQWTPLTKQNSNTDWEKIFAKHISGKGLLIRMYYNNSFKPTQIKNGQRILKDIFFFQKEDTQMIKKHMEIGFSYVKSFNYAEKGLY